MSSHSDTQTSETEDEYTREISHNTYKLDNQLLEPTFPIPHIFHEPHRPLLPPNTTHNIPGHPPILMPLPFVLPPGGIPPPPPILGLPRISETQKPHALIMPPLLPLLDHNKPLILPEQQSGIGIRTNTSYEPPKEELFLPQFGPGNLARFPLPLMISVTEPHKETQFVPPDSQEQRKVSPLFEHRSVPHFPAPFVPIISQSEGPRETQLETPDGHNVTHFPPHFDPKNIPLFPPPMMPGVKPSEETHFMTPVSQETKFPLQFEPKNIPLFLPPMNPEPHKETHFPTPDAQNQPLFMPRFDPNKMIHFPPPLNPNIPPNEHMKEPHSVPNETQNIPHFPTPINPNNIPILMPNRQQNFPGTEEETQFRQNMPHFQPHEQREIYFSSNEPQKETHFGQQEPHREPQLNPHLEAAVPRFMPPELRETHFRQNVPQKETHFEQEPHREQQTNPHLEAAVPRFMPPELRETHFRQNAPQKETHFEQQEPHREPQPNPHLEAAVPRFMPPEMRETHFRQNVPQKETHFEQQEPHREPQPSPHLEAAVPRFMPPELRETHFRQNVPQKETHFEQQEPHREPQPNPHLEAAVPRFMPPEMRETHFRQNMPQNETNIPIHSPVHFQPRFPPFPQPSLNQETQSETEIFDTSPQSEPNQFPPKVEPTLHFHSPDPQTEMWRPISNENIRFPNPTQFQPPRTQFTPGVSPNEQTQNPDDRSPNLETNEPHPPTTTEPSQPQTLQPIVTQTQFETQNQPNYSHYHSEEMEFNPEHDIPGPHYHSMPIQRPPFIRPPFQRPYGPPREPFYGSYPMRHPMGPPRPPMGPMRFRPVWTEHVTMDGRLYHHNHDTMESFWDMPEFEEDPAPPMSHHFNPEILAESQGEIETGNIESVVQEVTPHPPPTKPINSTPVPGTEWCVVWTNDGKVFFFNAVINKSVWQIPTEIKEHPIARKLMERNPDLPAEPTQTETETGTEIKRVKLMEQSIELEKESSENNDSDNQMEESVEIVLQQSVKVKLPKKAKSVKNEFAISEEEARNIRALKPIESRISEYKEMLLQRGVSAFSTWEKEQPKVAFDPRYILLTAKERKPVFEQFSLERIHEEKREKNLKLKLRKESFFSLLSDAKVGSKTSFHEFTLKWSKDARFKEIEKVKEREKLFLEFQDTLKKKSKTQTKLSATEPPADKYSSYEEKNSKRNRIEASIREREREVSESRRNQKRVIEDQRSLHKRDEAKIKYKSNLTEMVRDTKTSFKSFEKELKSNPNYDDFIYSLSSDERLNYFEHQIDFLQNKKRTQFQACIEECQEIDFSTPFKKARKLIKNDPRFEAISGSETKREAEYTRHMQAKVKLAGDNFNQLLRETKLITYKTKSNISSNSKCLQEIEYILTQDRRYLNLECIKEERLKMLLAYINELCEKGCPPPPTATSPNRTRVK